MITGVSGIIYGYSSALVIARVVLYLLLIALSVRLWAGLRARMYERHPPALARFMKKLPISISLNYPCFLTHCSLHLLEALAIQFLVRSDEAGIMAALDDARMAVLSTGFLVVVGCVIIILFHFWQRWAKVEFYWDWKRIFFTSQKTPSSPILDKTTNGEARENVQ
jgi:hypothetical protein